MEPRDAGNPSRAARDPYLVVGVGASAGGLDAFGRFLRHMPSHPGIAVVYVQHLDPHHESMLPDLLARDAQMSVEAVHDETPVEGGHVYVIPPNTSLSVEGGVLRLGARLPAPDFARSIDGFLHSLAIDQCERAVGIILSGTGSDGTAGLRAIKEHGGTTIVQRPESAAYDSMPRSAITAGLADHVLSPEDMPHHLIEQASQPHPVFAGEPDELSSGTANAVCDILRVKTGHEFVGYKRTTLVRRIRRRMHDLNLKSGSEYLERLEQDSGEAPHIFKEMLIGVTSFFRDPGAFGAVAEQVLPSLLGGKNANDRVRVWVVGCASGEEAYSLAILLSEQLAVSPSAPKVQIFATDLDERSLQVARQGIYPESIRTDVSPERLARFFVSRDSSYQVNPELRQMCVFSKHNLLQDPPFPELDLISCRNLLIYLEPLVQARAIRLFHHALRDRGFLLLGSAETVGSPDLFEDVNRKQRLYRRLDGVSLVPLEFPLTRPTQPVTGDRQSAPVPTGRGTALTRSVERAILDEFVPSGMVVREGGEVLYLFGPTARYLGPSAGAPSASAFNMIHKGLRIELRRALQQAADTHRSTVVECSLEIEAGRVERVSLLVRPFNEAVVDAYLVIIKDAVAHTALGEPGVSLPAADLGALQNELRNTRQQLLATIDQLESANQELQSSNEELLSLNEELQAANEELQSSKEEVQTINAELESVNRQLTVKVEELGVATSDLESLFEGAQLATIFLDNDLLIKRFTPTATEVFRLRPGDVGRPVTDITARFTNGDVVGEIRKVLRTLQRREVMVTRADDGNRYLMRILPYRTRQNVIDGVVVSFVDVTDLKRAQEALERLNADLERSASSLLATGRRKDDFLAMLSHELRNPLAAIASNIDLWQARESADPLLVRSCEVARRQVAHMTNLLNDLMDIAQIIRGTIELQRQPLDLREILSEVVDAYERRAADRDQEIVLSVPPEPLAVEGDEDRLYQVLDNLLDNAHKYTPAGGHIRVSAEVVNGEAVVRVSDDGIGVEHESLPHVFEAFVRGPRHGERAHDGLGLGLSLVHHLVGLHGGRVAAHSAGPGMGSEFVVQLPVVSSERLVTEQASNAGTPLPASGDVPKRVLIVDDNADGAEMLAAVLKVDGHETVIASDGRTALQLAAEHQPEVVFLDLGLPDIDGLEVARRLRREPRLAGARLVALTGYGQEEDRRQSVVAGFDHYLLKPVDVKVLREVLRTLFSGNP
ncbi:MAG TPA: chemotaxis protein CheB [Vicinamibacterales bacterium]|nr:chemotaxis protein CheB [Vicinamibacterales bacterium]